MRVEVTIKSNRVVDAIMGEIGPESRRQLNSVAGRAVMNAVQRHIRSYMREKHRSARMSRALRARGATCRYGRALARAR